jgi:DNA repair protein RadD
MSITLRDYQVDIIERTRALMRSGVRSICIQGPTGMGKTALVAQMLKTASERGLTSWFLLHRRELITQSIRAFDKVGVHHGVQAATFLEDTRAPVQICGVQTLINRLDRLKKPNLIVYDECHHIAAGSWSKIFNSYPAAYHIGVTATPERLDGRGLSDYFKELVEGPTVEWLIKNNYLSPYRLFAPPMPDQKFHTRMGDFVKSEIVEAMNKPKITGSAIHEYKKLATGKRAVVFCASIEHSKAVVSEFIQAGISAEHVDGETDQSTRDAAIKRFASGETLVLSNVELFGEGFDLPAIEVAILLRPTQSLGLYLQQVGRSLRPYPGKTEAIILDHAGNCARHGLPDENRIWSLEGRDIKSRGEKAQSIKVCPRCFGAQVSGISSRCIHCGHEFEVQAREIEQVEGELTEISLEKLKSVRRAEQGRAKDLADLIAVGRSRGYKRPELWARHVYMGRKRGG